MFLKFATLAVFFGISCYAELSETQMQEKFTAFKTSPLYKAEPGCSNSVLFLERLNCQFLTELDPANKLILIEVMEKILYRGTGVGGLSGRACTPKEYAVMTESAVILELWHKKLGTARYFSTKVLPAQSDPLIQKHYQTLKYISIAADKTYNADGTLRFFHTVLPDVLTDINSIKAVSEADMTERQLLEIPAMRELDILVANIVSSVGFMQCGGNTIADYAALSVDDGLNALRTDMRNLMSATTVTAALLLVNDIETKCWDLSLDDLETAEVDKKTLIKRALAAVERIKSVRFDGNYKTKDPRPAEDKLKGKPVAADANTKKKNTLLLLMSMAMQEKYYNPLNNAEDIQKIILAKLQQSNYWEGGAAALLTGKTDLNPYPAELPDYAPAAIEEVIECANVVPPVYAKFVDAIQMRAMANKLNIHFVGGNTFLQMESSGHLFQCGFFSFGLMDDGAHNARQKFFDIFSNSLDLNTLRDVAQMASVLEMIELYAKGAEDGFKLFKNIVKTGERDVPGRPGKKEGVYEARDFYKGAEKLSEGIQTLDRNVIHRELEVLIADYEARRAQEARRLGLVEVNGHFGLDDEDPKRRGFQLLEWNYNYGRRIVCVQALQRLLLTNKEARTAFSSYAKQVLAGRLLQEELSIGVEDYSDIRQQLLFRPGSDRYQSVTDLAILTTAVSPTQTIAEALNINVQVVSAPAQFVGNYGQIINHQEPSRAFSPGNYVLQDIRVSERAKDQVLYNPGGGHYQKLIPLSDHVALVRALRHLAWMRRSIAEIS